MKRFKHFIKLKKSAGMDEEPDCSSLYFGKFLLRAFGGFVLLLYVGSVVINTWMNTERLRWKKLHSCLGLAMLFALLRVGTDLFFVFSAPKCDKSELFTFSWFIQWYTELLSIVSVGMAGYASSVSLYILHERIRAERIFFKEGDGFRAYSKTAYPDPEKLID